MCGSTSRTCRTVPLLGAAKGQFVGAERSAQTRLVTPATGGCAWVSAGTARQWLWPFPLPARRGLASCASSDCHLQSQVVVGADRLHVHLHPGHLDRLGAE